MAFSSCWALSRAVFCCSGYDAGVVLDPLDLAGGLVLLALQVGLLLVEHQAVGLVPIGRRHAVHAADALGLVLDVRGALLVAERAPPQVPDAWTGVLLAVGQDGACSSFGPWRGKSTPSSGAWFCLGAAGAGAVGAST